LVFFWPQSTNQHPPVHHPLDECYFAYLWMNLN
jgi:hypothetical protein